MKEEAEILEEFSALEEELGRLAREREWAELDATISKMKITGEKMAQADQIRATVYGKIKRHYSAPPEETFQELLARIPSQEWGNLPELHRRTRMAVEKIKSLTGCLDAYISSAVNTMDRILDEVLPDRRNRIYTRRGEVFGAEQPLMVSRSI